MSAPTNLTVVQGYVLSITDGANGTIKDVNSGTIYNYTDTTLTTRSIVLAIGDKIIGVYSSTPNLVGHIVPLQAIYDTVNDTIVGDRLTASNVKCSLQIAQCCAVNKINKYIIDQQDGKQCENDFDDAETIFAMVDSLRGFIPQNDLLTGDQATYEIVVTSTFGAKVVTLHVGTAVYSFTSYTGTDNDFASDIAVNINLLYPPSYPYYAVASGQNVVISGIAFDADNTTAITGSTTNGTMTLSPPSYLFGGIAPVYQGINCLTNQEAQIILSKLKELCGC